MPEHAPNALVVGRLPDIQRMPLFSRSSFRTPKKPPRRKADSVPNLSAVGLDDTLNFTAESSVRREGGPPPVSMKLDDYNVSFEDGQWTIGKNVCCIAIFYRQIMYKVPKLFLNRAHHFFTHFTYVCSSLVPRPLPTF